jgi:hypothetical protein
MSSDRYDDEAAPVPGLAQLRLERTPPRDLWPGIEARLQPRRARRPWLPLALAASVVAGLAGLLTLQLRPDPVAPVPAPIVAMAEAPMALTSDARAIVKANLRMVTDAERSLQSALEQDPHSTSLHSLLAATRAQRSELRNLL